jgi:hypothetical protein
MATNTTPHTQTQQNENTAQADLEPNQLAQDTAQNDDAAVYENAAGAQTGGTRAFNANAGRDNLPNTQQFSSAMTGSVNTRTPQGETQGITNHSASEESERQEKVVSERPDAQAGVDVGGWVGGNKMKHPNTPQE